NFGEGCRPAHAARIRYRRGEQALPRNPHRVVISRGTGLSSRGCVRVDNPDHSFRPIQRETTMSEKKTQPADNHLVAELRENFGKGYARRLRASGRVPAVIYGHGTDPQHVSLPAHEVSLILRKANAILDL